MKINIGVQKKKVRELLHNVNNSGYLSREGLGFCGGFALLFSYTFIILKIKHIFL